LLEVKVLQAILFDKRRERDKAKAAPLSSLEISELEGIILYSAKFIEN